MAQTIDALQRAVKVPDAVKTVRKAPSELWTDGTTLDRQIFPISEDEEIVSKESEVEHLQSALESSTETQISHDVIHVFTALETIVRQFMSPSRFRGSSDGRAGTDLTEAVNPCHRNSVHFLHWASGRFRPTAEATSSSPRPSPRSTYRKRDDISQVASAFLNSLLRIDSFRRNGGGAPALASHRRALALQNLVERDFSEQLRSSASGQVSAALFAEYCRPRYCLEKRDTRWQVFFTRTELLLHQKLRSAPTQAEERKHLAKHAAYDAIVAADRMFPPAEERRGEDEWAVRGGGGGYPTGGAGVVVRGRQEAEPHLRKIMRTNAFHPHRSEQRQLADRMCVSDMIGQMCLRFSSSSANRHTVAAGINGGIHVAGSVAGTTAGAPGSNAGPKKRGGAARVSPSLSVYVRVANRAQAGRG